MAPIAQGSIDDGRPSRIRFRVEAARLEVMPEEHQAEVHYSMQTRVFESSRFPEISFASKDIQQTGDNTWHVSGNLQLYGESRLIHLSVRKLDGRYVGSDGSLVPLQISPRRLTLSVAAAAVACFCRRS